MALCTVSWLCARGQSRHILSLGDFGQNHFVVMDVSSHEKTRHFGLRVRFSPVAKTIICNDFGLKFYCAIKQ